MDYNHKLTFNLGTLQASVDDDKVVKGVHYFNEDQPSNSRRNNAVDKQFMEYNDGTDHANKVNPINIG